MFCIHRLQRTSSPSQLPIQRSVVSRFRFADIPDSRHSWSSWRKYVSRLPAVENRIDEAVVALGVVHEHCCHCQRGPSTHTPVPKHRLSMMSKSSDVPPLPSPLLKWWPGCASARLIFGIDDQLATPRLGGHAWERGAASWCLIQQSKLHQ